ncbi:MAG: Mut7-C RNAse domain-containing protein [Candidatus Bathyarchaeia archaeon]
MSLEVKFLLDSMFGSLARWLRICGYDAEYIKNIQDDEIVQRSLEEKRVILTRDKLLYKKALKAGANVLHVEGDNDTERLSFIRNKLGIILEPEQSRCPVCGGLLKYTEKNFLKGRIPTMTYEHYNDFWICNSCGKIYWKGSHWINILKTVNEASTTGSNA